jgi:UPF0042 nucleotide-binding protein
MIVVTGLSGAGKTVVLNALEDFGFYCIDNLPISLFTEFLSHILQGGEDLYQRVALGIDARNPPDVLTQFPNILHQLGMGDFETELVFVEANHETLLRRFSETRRRHPLSSSEISLWDAIHKERALLSPLCDQADLRIDTSHYHVHLLRDYVRERVAYHPLSNLSLQFVSFGFKHGIPLDTDFVFDVRCLPNPHWEAHLRDHSGQDPQVIEFLEKTPMVKEMAQHISAFLDSWIPQFEAENRSYLTIAIGCTGGHHRSVYIAERLAAHFKTLGKHVLTRHRDL